MKIFFIGETSHSNAQSWLKGIKEYSDFEIETWKIEHKKGAFGNILRTWTWLYSCFFLKRRIHKSKADLLICERVTSYGFLGACTGFHPMVVSQQGITDVWPPNSISTPFKAILARWALKKADMIHAWGEVMIPALLELGANPAKIKVLPRGVDLNRFNFKAEGKHLDKIKAIVTRSLTSDYNHDVIIKAAKTLKDNNIPLEIKIVGDGILMNKLKMLAKELDVEDIVSFTGRIQNDQLPFYLAEANMYISVPISEGVSASLFEAMGGGAFPIVTDLPGTRPWIRHGENGFLIPVNDSKALAESIITAWNNKTLMQNAILANRSFVEEKADYNKNMTQFVAWYKELIKNKLKAK